MRVAPDVGGGLAKRWHTPVLSGTWPCVWAGEVGGGARGESARVPWSRAYGGRRAAVQRKWDAAGLRVQMVADLWAYFLPPRPVPILTSHRLAGPRNPGHACGGRGVVTNKPPTRACRGRGPEQPSVWALIDGRWGCSWIRCCAAENIPPERSPTETPRASADSGHMGALWTGPWSCRTTTTGAQSSIRRPWCPTHWRRPGHGRQGLRRPCPAPDGLRAGHREPSGRSQSARALTAWQGATIFAQTLADALGVAPADVQVVHSGGARAHGYGRGASRGLM